LLFFKIDNLFFDRSLRVIFSSLSLLFPMKKKQKIQAQNVSSRCESTENAKQNKLACAILRLKQYFVFNAF